MSPVAIFVGVVLAVLVLCAAIWRALISDGALPHWAWWTPDMDPDGGDR